jgi:hypothetical protein
LNKKNMAEEAKALRESAKEARAEERKGRLRKPPRGGPKKSKKNEIVTS